jgi:hypothetical protein
MDMYRRRFPHTISYRLTDEDYLRIKNELKETRLTPHDWCREAALEKLNEANGLQRSQQIIFNQVARTQYLVSLGFQLLAENKLTSEEWKKLRAYAKSNVKIISTKVLEEDPT